jgi:hypothetical protein
MKLRTLLASLFLMSMILSLLAGCSVINRQQTFGPTGFTLSPQENYDYTLSEINKGSSVSFSFSSSGALVNYYVLDPNNNTLLTGNGGNKTASGAGSFVAAASGQYTIEFHCTGILSSSAVTISGTIN